MSYAVRNFYQNGGGLALIVRLLQANGQSVARVGVSTTSHDSGGTATGAGAPFNLISAIPDARGNRLRVTIDHETRPHEAGETLATLFNLKLELIPDTGVASLQQLPDLGTGVAEIFTNVFSVAGLPNCLDTVLRNKSELIRVEDLLPGAQPDIGVANVSLVANGGAVLASRNFTGNSATRTRVHALLKVALFNMHCIPSYIASGVNVIAATVGADLRRRFRDVLLVDPWQGLTERMLGVRDGPSSSR